MAQTPTGDETHPDPPPEPSADDQTSTQRRPKKGGALRETLIVVVIALVVSALIKTFLVQAFVIPSESMEPTLQIGDRVLVSRLAPGPFDLHRGDIVVFEDPGGWLTDPTLSRSPLQQALVSAGEWIGLLPAGTGTHVIKRIVGMPGDTVTCCDAAGRITVNGVAIDEDYLVDVEPSRTPFTVTVPEDALFVLGDNRSNSGDSRYHQDDANGGFVPIEDVVGVAQVRMWPVNRWALLRNPGDVFVDVPNPS